MTFCFSSPYTSSQNDKAEYMIRTINNMIRTLLFHASLPLTFWVYALYMVPHLLNLLPTSVLQYKTPAEFSFHRILVL